MSIFLFSVPTFNNGCLYKQPRGDNICLDKMLRNRLNSTSAGARIKFPQRSNFSRDAGVIFSEVVNERIDFFKSVF